MDKFKHGELVVFSVDAQCEKKPSVASIYYLVVPILQYSVFVSKEMMMKSAHKGRIGGLNTTYLEEAGHFVIALDYGPMSLRLNLFPFVFIVGDVPSTQSCLSLPVLQ